MKILALDTATETCSAAMLTDGRIAARCIELRRGHAEQILGMVDAVLIETGVRLRDLDAVAFGRGPGAFTGVRLAASVAQGLAFGADIPVVPISDLRALAQRVFDSAPQARGALVCCDARMQEVYWGFYERDEVGLARLAGAEHVSAPDEVRIPSAARSPVHAGGRGLIAYPRIAARLRESLAMLHEDLVPRAEEIARLAVAEVQAGRTVAAEAALPVYLRDDVARPPSRGGPS